MSRKWVLPSIRKMPFWHGDLTIAQVGSAMQDPSALRVLAMMILESLHWTVLAVGLLVSAVASSASAAHAPMRCGGRVVAEAERQAFKGQWRPDVVGRRTSIFLSLPQTPVYAQAVQCRLKWDGTR